MFITKKHLSRRTFLRAGGATIGLPLLGAMVPAATALVPNGGGRQAAAWVLLPAARRHHGQYPPRRGDEPLDARPHRARLRLEADSRAVRSASEVPDGGERPRQSHGREPVGARDLPRHLAHLRRAAEVANTECGRVDRPNRRSPHRPRDAVAVARARDGRARRQWRVRRDVWLQLQPHDLVPHADDAAADGSGPRQSVRENFRPRHHGCRAQRDRVRLLERARLGDDGDQGPRARPRRRGPRHGQRLPRQRARARAPYPTAQCARSVERRLAGDSRSHRPPSTSVCA